MLNKQANASQQKFSRLSMQVTDDLTVQVIANPDYEFLMDTKTVAIGYGVSEATIRSHKGIHSDELVENSHFISSVENINAGNLQTKQVYWTKKGVIRLGFFIKSERAKLFRDWAEQVIIQAIAPKVTLPQAKRRNHNRLTNQRLVEILADIALIDDKDLRISLMEKLLPDNTILQTTLFTTKQLNEEGTSC